MSVFKAVVFDLFYTLINPLDPRFMADNEYRTLGMTREKFERRNADGYEQWADGGIMDPYEEIALMMEGLGFSAEMLRRAADARMERIHRGLMGVDKKNLDLLKRLRSRNIKTALVSNADCMDIRYWKDAPLHDCFDEVIFSCNVGIMKPDPKIFALVLQKIGLSPGECLYVGDGGHKELRGAKEAGMTSVLTTEYIAGLWPQRIPEFSVYADHVITRLGELEEIVF